MKNRPMKGGSGGVVVHRPLGLQPGERRVRSQRPGKRRASTPDVAARFFPSGAPARAFDPATPLRAGPGKRLFQIRTEVAAGRHPRRPALDPSVAFDHLPAIRRPCVRHPAPVHAGLMEVGLVGRDQPDRAPFFSAAFCTKGGRTRPASALMTAPSRGNASRRASAAAYASPSGTVRCAQTGPTVTPARVTDRRASVASRTLPRSHVSSRARSRSAGSRGPAPAPVPRRASCALHTRTSPGSESGARRARRGPDG